MVKIDVMINEGKVSKIGELELGRYVGFFENAYRDNLAHCKAVLAAYPRWSIISGYYAMHDVTKLFLARRFSIKVEYEVHSTTIKVLAELIKNKELISFMEKGYREFISLANDLAEAKTERVKTQYYTGTEFMKAEYQKRASAFLKETVEPYIGKIILLGELER